MLAPRNRNAVLRGISILFVSNNFYIGWFKRRRRACRGAGPGQPLLRPLSQQPHCSARTGSATSCPAGVCAARKALAARPGLRLSEAAEGGCRRRAAAGLVQEKIEAIGLVPLKYVMKLLGLGQWAPAAAARFAAARATAGEHRVRGVAHWRGVRAGTVALHSDSEASRVAGQVVASDCDGQPQDRSIPLVDQQTNKNAGTQPLPSLNRASGLSLDLRVCCQPKSVGRRRHRRTGTSSKGPGSFSLSELSPMSCGVRLRKAAESDSESESQ